MNTSSIGDMPVISSVSYGTSTTSTSDSFSGVDAWTEALNVRPQIHRRISSNAVQPHSHQPNTPKKDDDIMTTSNRRLVQVFIADPDPALPNDAALLYKGDLKFTDGSDQELYFEVPVVELLSKHNIVRKAVMDKDATRKAGKDVFLDEIKIRDLRMVVITVAQF